MPRWIGRQSYYVQHGDWFIAWCAVLALPRPGRRIHGLAASEGRISRCF